MKVNARRSLIPFGFQYLNLGYGGRMKHLLIAALKQVIGNTIPTYEEWLEGIEKNPGHESIIRSTKKDIKNKNPAYSKEKFNEWFDEYQSMEFPFTVYRGLCLVDLADLDLNNVGIHWTRDLEKAGCIIPPEGMEDDDEYILTADVDENMIDWVSTFANNLSQFGKHEDEITLKPNMSIKISDVSRSGHSLNKSFRGKS